MRRVKFASWMAWVLLACVVVADVFALLLPGQKEPVFDGTKLSDWLEQYNRAVAATDQQKSEEAANAVRQIGVSGLPCLVHWMKNETPTWERKMAYRLPKWLGGAMVTGLLNKRDVQQATAQLLAILGFGILGKDASVAVPELVRLANAQGEERAEGAIIALGSVGAPGLGPLAGVVTNGNLAVECRCWAVFEIGEMANVGTNAAWVVPVLVRCLEDREAAQYAAYALGRLGLRSEIAVPALAECVQSSDENLRRTAIWSLGLFGDQARAAVPVLLPVLNETEWKAPSGAGRCAIDFGEVVGNGPISQVATNALLKIAPEVLRGTRDRDTEFLNFEL